MDTYRDETYDGEDELVESFKWWIWYLLWWKEDKYLFYYQDNIVDVTHMFDKEKELLFNNQ